MDWQIKVGREQRAELVNPAQDIMGNSPSLLHKQVEGQSAGGKDNDDAQGLFGLLDAISAGSCLGISVAICNVMQHHQPIEHPVEELGGTEPLVRMLASSALPMPVRRSAAAAIFGREFSSTSTQDVDELDMCIRGQDLQTMISLLSSSTAKCQEEVLLAIWAICKHNPDLSGQMCQLGALQLLVGLLESSSTSCQANAALTISVLCRDDEIKTRQVCLMGGLQMFVALLSSCSVRCQENAVLAICKLCKDDNASIAALVNSGGLPLLVGLLSRATTPRGQALAAAGMSQLCSNSQLQQQLMELRVLQPLISLLSSSSCESHRSAVEAIAQLANRSIDQNDQAHFAELGCLQPLIHLLACPILGCQATAPAARALADLCIDEGVSHQAGALDALQPLIDLLNSGSDDCLSSAARAIANICRDSAHSMQAVTLGALPALTQLLGKQFSSSCQGMAAAALARICWVAESAIPQVTELGGLAQLIRLLTDISSSEFCRAHAASALAALDRNEQSAIQLAQLNGLQPLIRLLSSSSADCQFNALRAIGHVCHLEIFKSDMVQPALLRQLVTLVVSATGQRQHVAVETIARICSSFDSAAEHVAEMGILQPLIHLLRTSSAQTQASAAGATVAILQNDDVLAKIHEAVLLELVIVFSAMLTSSTMECQKQAAAAIGKMCTQTCSANDRVAEKVLQQGGFEPLVKLLASPNTACQAHAATAITNLYSRAAFAAQVSLQARAVLKPLINLLASSSPECQKSAVSAIANICAQDERAGGLVTELDGMHPIIGLLGSASSESQAAAARALANMCDTAVLSSQMAQLEALPSLVNLLSSSSTECQQQAAAAIRMICSGNDAACSQLEQLNALQPLACLLSSRSTDCQQAAIRAITSLQHSEALKQQMAKREVLQPLVTLVASSTANNQQIASQAIAGICLRNAGAAKHVTEIGILQPLACLLRTSAAECQLSAACAVIAITEHHGALSHIHEEVIMDMLQVLLDLLRTASSECQEHAALAIGQFCPCVANDQGIAEEVRLSISSTAIMKGMGPLIEMLASPSGSCQRAAAGAIAQLSSHAPASVQASVHAALPPLISLLASADSMCRALATWAISSICAQDGSAADLLTEFGGVQPIIHLLADSDCQVAAAMTIASMCHQVNLCSQTAQLGALPLLVDMLSSPRMECQWAAVEAIEAICSVNETACTHFAQLEGVRLLTGLLLSPHEEVKIKAQRTLDLLRRQQEPSTTSSNCLGL